MNTPENQSRRNFIALMGMTPFLKDLVFSHSEASLPGNTCSGSVEHLPCPEQFAVRGTYLNAAYTHPLSIESASAIKDYTDYRLMNGHAPHDFRTRWDEVKAMYAGLINAKPEEIAWIPGTMAGENMVVNSLGIPGSHAKVVTDALHFDGSLYMYDRLSRNGADVKVVMPENNRIDLKRMDAAITPGTKLVAVSLVSMVNGFQHDLKKLCEIAHSRGALVYADIIQAVGAVPLDVHDSGVDFCAASSFKWLMGDFGAGFLYASENSRPHIHRDQYGYRQVTDTISHFLPYDAPGNIAYEFSASEDAAGYFEVGSLANEAVAALGKSLSLITEIGVKSIMEYRQPMLRLLHDKLPSLGFVPMTPEESTSPIITFALKDAKQKLDKKLRDSGINIQVYDNRFRISPSIYNTMDDIEKLIDVLKK